MSTYLIQFQFLKTVRTQAEFKLLHIRRDGDVFLHLGDVCDIDTLPREQPRCLQTKALCLSHSEMYRCWFAEPNNVSTVRRRYLTREKGKMLLVRYQCLR